MDEERRESIATNRDKEERSKKHREKLWKIHSHRFYHPFGYYPVGEGGRFTDDEDEILFYRRYSCHPKYRKYLKRQSNKAVRRMDQEELLRGSDYKKLFDLWWELY